MPIYLSLIVAAILEAGLNILKNSVWMERIEALSMVKGLMEQKLKFQAVNRCVCVWGGGAKAFWGLGALEI